jgi:hypothetical protein
MFGLIIIINTRIDILENTFECTNLDEAQKKLVNCLALEFNKLNINFPIELTDFECEWFDRNYMKANAFYYNIFDSNESRWIKPWSLEDIYELILEEIQILEINNITNDSIID